MIEAHPGRRILRFDELPSTNDHAATLAADPASAGTVIVARSQTAGRGQYGRSWDSRAGAGVWMSVILRPPAELLRPAILTAWATVSVADVVEQFTNHLATIKWPNDVHVVGKKVAGILIEQGAATIVGIGLNVNQSAAEFAAAHLPDAGSLASLTWGAFDVEIVTNLLIDRLDRGYAEMLAGNLAPLESAWRRRLGVIDQRVVVEYVDGHKIRGKLEAMSFQQLDLRLMNGERVGVLPEEVRHISIVHHQED